MKKYTKTVMLVKESDLKTQYFVKVVDKCLYDIIGELAQELCKHSTTATGKDLALALNSQGFKNSCGRSWSIGTRGIFNTIRAAWKYHQVMVWCSNNDTNRKYHDTLAKCIASAFTKENGEYAYT